MLKKRSFIKKIFNKNVTIWLVASVLYTGGFFLLANMLHGITEVWRINFLIGVAALCVSGILFAVWASPYRGKRLTESPTDSMKELLDRIVREYTSGPCTVIDLTFKTPELRDAICAKLTAKLLGDLYREAAEEAKVDLDEDPKFYTRVIECKWDSN